jgi:hypothetical protein
VSRPAAVALLGLVLQACTGVAYRPLDSPEPAAPPWQREVRYALDPAFFHDPPACVVVLPTEGGPDALAEAVEAAFTRSLSVKVPRVIGAVGRNRMTRPLGLDLTAEDGRRRFARQAGCPFVATSTVTAAGAVFALVWAQVTFGLTLEIRRAVDDQAVWTARHEARRGDGGLPLSLPSLGSAAARAGMTLGDEEANASMVDDALRRMMATLPDLR